MTILARLLKNSAFGILNHSKQRGFHLMNDLTFWFKDRPVEMIFDVGANVGQTVQMMRTYFPAAYIEAFEPIDSTFRILQERCQDLQKIHLNNLALGNSIDQRSIYLAGNSCLNSLLNVGDNAATSTNLSQTQLVTVTTMDEFCSNKGIDHINLLKTDVQGYDLEVIKGAERLLENQKIDFILAEVGFDPTQYITNFCSVHECLYAYGYKLVGFYDLVHDSGFKPNLTFCNVVYASEKFSSH